MRYSKNAKPSLMAISTVSLKELTEMANFIRNFKEKYSRAKTSIPKKK